MKHETSHRNQYSKAVGPKLYSVLITLLLLIALLAINSIYLAGVTFYEWLIDTSIQDAFYLWMFLGHLVLGITVIIPLSIYGFIHAKNTQSYKNKTAKRAGYLLLISSFVVIITGLLLTRLTENLESFNSHYRLLIYWLHVLIPVFCCWLFVLHRLAGRSLNLKLGKWVVVFTLLTLLAYITLSEKEVKQLSDNGHLTPTFATTDSGGLIPAHKLNNNEFCTSCHEDTHQQWLSSVHHFSSFNNPAYAFAVNNTREKMKARDGHADAARLCAVCHDPVLLFSGEFDGLTKEQEKLSNAQAGITCSSCHLIEQINSHKGNGAFQLALPVEYPLTESEDPLFKWVNNLLIKSKPDLHKSTYLKPLHQDALFCSTCHKVSLPAELNDFRWLRGQNHFDSFWLSGVSGHKVNSFYYPPKAKEACQDCHMKPIESDDIAADYVAESGMRLVKDHRFDVANNAIKYLKDQLHNEKHSELLKNSVEIDLFGIKTDEIDLDTLQISDGRELTANNEQTYIIEAVLKTKTLGHLFTQGTADSNQIWLEIAIYDNNQLIAHNGGVNDAGELNPYAYLANAFIIDREGNKIELRNAEDIYTALYNHQIPPGAAAIVHFEFDLPPETSENIHIEANLYYRKFNTKYYRAFMNQPDLINDLPVVKIASSNLNLNQSDGKENSKDSLWKRWNDYGIALLRNKEYKSAAYAFNQVINSGKPHGLINLLRVHLQEGRLGLAQELLDQAIERNDYPYPWHLDYFTGKLHFLNGRINEAITSFHIVMESQYETAVKSDFDFSKDYGFLTEVAQAYIQMALNGEEQKITLRGTIRMSDMVTKCREFVSGNP